MARQPVLLQRSGKVFAWLTQDAGGQGGTGDGRKDGRAGQQGRGTPQESPRARPHPRNPEQHTAAAHLNVLEADCAAGCRRPLAGRLQLAQYLRGQRGAAAVDARSFRDWRSINRGFPHCRQWVRVSLRPANCARLAAAAAAAVAAAVAQQAAAQLRRLCSALTTSPCRN